jgi:hypothetical protein
MQHPEPSMYGKRAIHFAAPFCQQPSLSGQVIFQQSEVNRVLAVGRRDGDWSSQQCNHFLSSRATGPILCLGKDAVMRHGLKLFFLLTSLAFAVSAPAFCSAEDFRIDTEIFRGSYKTPEIEVLTIFHSGNVYDFQLTEPQEITVFEPRRGVLTLLNVKEKKKASVTTQELLNAALNMQGAAVASGNAVFAAAAEPVFKMTSADFKENNSNFTKLTFAGKPIQYTVTGQAARHPAAANEYRYFSDWSARLSSLRPGNLPAGARLEVNDAIAKKGLLPTKVERVIQESRFGKKIEVRSEHLVVWTLSQEDVKRIDIVGDQLTQFTLVPFEQFCGLGQPSAKVATPQQQFTQQR